MQEVEEDRCQRGVGGRQAEGVKTRMKGLGRRHSSVILERERKKKTKVTEKKCFCEFTETQKASLFRERSCRQFE